jgi:hypothetical protein
MVSAARYNGFDDGELTGTFRNVVSKLRRRTLGATSYIGASPCVQQRFFTANTVALSMNAAQVAVPGETSDGRVSPPALPTGNAHALRCKKPDLAGWQRLPERHAGLCGAPGMTGCGQPFMPVRVTPWMKYFCAKKKMTMTGSVIMSEPAIIMPMEPPACTLKAYKPRASGYSRWSCR